MYVKIGERKGCRLAASVFAILAASRSTLTPPASESEPSICILEFDSENSSLILAGTSCSK